jgi:hypothetical protein
MTTQGGIKGQKELMGRHINRANKTQHNRSNGKYETVINSLN